MSNNSGGVAMSASVATTYQASPYGAAELKRVYQKYWWIALCIAVVIHFLALGAYYAVGILGAEEEVPMVKVRLKYSDLGPPPSITNTNIPPPTAVSTPVQKPTVGAPVPVPDAEASAETTIPTQAEMSQTVAPITEGLGEGGVDIEQDITIEDEGPPADFVAVEKEPVVVKKVEPKYPELAMRAGLEGTVWVKMWVDKEGKVKQAVIIKSAAEIFNDPALEAARQFVFTPAYMNNGPVSVWVSVPFRFKLADRK